MGGNWVFAQAQHTGTEAVASFLEQHAAQLNLSAGCPHVHDACVPRDLRAVVAFAANPFRRVLTHAAYRGAIGGPRRPFRGTPDEEVQAFRRFVTSMQFWKAGMVGVGPRIHIWQQVFMLQKYPATARQLVGRTATLGKDLHAALHELGYRGVGSLDGAVGCKSSCNTTRGTPKRNGEDWYDENATAKVRMLFEPDFAAFNFSRDPKHMYDLYDRS